MVEPNPEKEALYEGSKPVREATAAELTPEGQQASEDSALAALLGGLGDDDDVDDFSDIPETARVQEEPTEEAPEPVEPEEAPEPEAAPTQAQPDDTAYRLAAAALRRDGWSTEDIALLPADRVLALGDKRSKVQGDMDTAYAELVQLRGQQGAARENEARRGENEAEAPAGVDTKALAEQLGIDEDRAPILAEFLRQAQSPLLERVTAAERAAAESQRLAMRQAAETARAGLAERFPQIKDPAAFKRVLDRMDKIQPHGTYGDASELMEDAVLLEFRDDIRAEGAKRTQEIRRARANGQPVTTQPARTEGSEKKAKTREDIEREVFNRLFDPNVKDPEERRKNARAAVSD